MPEFWLSASLTTAAYGWRLERRDGVTLCFTSHDRDLSIDGLVYRASPGLVPTAIAETGGFEVDGFELQGALTAETLRADDLRAGRWDDAAITIFLLDWTNPSAGKRYLASGFLGAVDYAKGKFSVDIAGPTAPLNGVVAPYASPVCRARFCDRHCGLNPGRFRQGATVAYSADRQIELAGWTEAALQTLINGELHFVSGANCGLRRTVLAVANGRLLIGRAPDFPVTPDSKVEVIEGCNKTFAMCRDRYANMVNFRGEPQLPGNDLLMRYPAL